MPRRQRRHGPSVTAGRDRYTPMPRRPQTRTLGFIPPDVARVTRSLLDYLPEEDHDQLLTDLSRDAACALGHAARTLHHLPPELYQEVLTVATTEAGRQDVTDEANRRGQSRHA